MKPPEYESIDGALRTIQGNLASFLNLAEKRYRGQVSFDALVTVSEHIEDGTRSLGLYLLAAESERARREAGER